MLFNKRIPPRRGAVEVVANRVLFVIVLMVRFGGEEFCARQNLHRERLVVDAARVYLDDHALGFFSLCIVRIIDRWRIRAPAVVERALGIRRIAVFYKVLRERRIRDFRLVVRDLHHFAEAARIIIFVRWRRVAFCSPPAGVPRHCFNNFGQLFQIRLHAPKTPARKYGGLHFLRYALFYLTFFLHRF